ncbi:MAG: fumarylacetoacetate hydrolase family protein [Oscillospiraceae bacterium]|jgi:2-keto-4-pentenoate hydratase/2-oxohepta-3-ene-1,7-dioic acid hydratase in catechol pathway
MKYVKILHEGIEKWGVLEEDYIRTLSEPPYERIVFDGNKLQYGGAKLLAPCDAGKVVCVGKNYREHALELGGSVPDYPILFIKPSTSIIAHDEDIVYHPWLTRVDYEAELAFVIKKRAWRVPPEEAAGYILGYTCLNDVTAREIQRQDVQWTRAKSLDTFCPIGPIVTDECDPDSLEVMALLNGEIRQRANTSAFITDTAHMLSFITQGITLLPGDVVATGTPAGIGPMRPGDIIEIVIPGVGTLRNRVTG